MRIQLHFRDETLNTLCLCLRVIYERVYACVRLWMCIFNSSMRGKKKEIIERPNDIDIFVCCAVGFHPELHRVDNVWRNSYDSMDWKQWNVRDMVANIGKKSLHIARHVQCVCVRDLQMQIKHIMNENRKFCGHNHRRSWCVRVFLCCQKSMLRTFVNVFPSLSRYVLFPFFVVFKLSNASVTFVKSERVRFWLCILFSTLCKWLNCSR